MGSERKNGIPKRGPQKTGTTTLKGDRYITSARTYYEINNWTTGTTGGNRKYKNNHKLAENSGISGEIKSKLRGRI